MSDILNKLNLKPAYDKPIVHVKERDEKSGCGVLYTSFWEFFTNSDANERFKDVKEDSGPLGSSDTDIGNYDLIINEFAPYVMSHAKFMDPEKGIVEIPVVPETLERFKVIVRKVVDACSENKFDHQMCEVIDPRNKGVLFLVVSVGVYCIARDVDLINAFERTESDDFIATFPAVAVIIAEIAVMEKGPDGRDWIKKIPLPE